MAVQRGSVLAVWAENLVIETCCVCAMAFAMPQTFKNERIQDGEWFYCPSGHRQHYTQHEDEIAALKKQLARANGNEKYYRERMYEEQARKEAEQRSKAAIKGQLTKVKKRVAAGVCPCCNRTFQNLKDHMAGQHPDYAPQETTNG